jgi:CLIP-associating protein 1/2
LNDKTVQARQLASSQLKLLIETHKASHEASRDGDLFGQALKKGVADANPVVRQNSRSAFWTYHEVWTREAQKILDQLDPSVRAQLEKSKGGDNDLSKSTSSLSSLASKPARPSVRQMISAQRRAPLAPTASSSSLSSWSSIKADTPAEEDLQAMPPPKSTSPSPFRRSGPRTPSSASVQRATSSSSSTSKRSSLASNENRMTPRSVSQATPTRATTRPSASLTQTPTKEASPETSPLSARMAALSVNDARSTSGESQDRLVVEEIKAQANQAEEAAARLLELADDDDATTTLPSPRETTTNGHGRASSSTEVGRNGMDSWWIQQANREFCLRFAECMQ